MSKIASPDSYEVAVVGAGPAGSIAAFCLAQAGLKVALLEKQKLPRYKTCGGGLVGRAIRLLPFDVTSVVERECHRASMNLLDADLSFLCEREDPIISMTMRDQLDYRLASAAIGAGAELFESCEVSGFAADRNRIVLTTKRGRIGARWVIAADGATGFVARAAGWRPNRNAIPGLEYEVTVADNVLEEFCHSARFDFGIVPDGYAWVFPKKGHLSVGVLSTRRGRTGLHDYIQQYLVRIGIRSVKEVVRHGFVIPLRPVEGPFVKQRTLPVGDAAGLVDPVTAEGISFAILSGQLASRAIIESNLDDAHLHSLYDSKLRKHVLPELRAGRLLARLLYGFPRIRTRLFRRHGQRLVEAVLDVLMGTKTYQAAVTNPANYFRLLQPRP